MNLFVPSLKSLPIIVSCLLYASCNSNEASDTMLDVSEVSGPWNLIFEEEFDSDLSLWNVWDGGAFNEEIQLYREQQLRIENGLLSIDTSREDVVGPTSIFDATTKSFEYVSGRIESQEIFGPSDVDGEREYRFVASIKLPSGNGMWPAFWTYGDPWPTQGEIDVLEARGGSPLEFQSNIFYGTTANVNINRDTEVVHDIGTDLTEEFHTYEMIWKANSIDILFDENPIHTYTANTNNNINALFGKKQKVVINTAVGGLFFTDRNPDNYADNATMQVDWIRVYKR